MSEMQGPNLGTDTVRIHLVITRGLEVSIEHSAAFALEGFPDGPTREGFAAYVGALVSLLHGHHSGEDELLFPFLQDKLPDGPFGELMAQHEAMVPVLDGVQAALAGEELAELNAALAMMARLWARHIELEEATLAPERLAALIDPAEHGRVGGLLAKHSMEHAEPIYLVAPFVLYNLPPDERAILSQLMPPELTQELVPIVWKDMWAPMKPFLLD